MAAKKRTKKKTSAKTRKARIPKSWAAMARMMDRVGKKFDTIPKKRRKSRGLSGSSAEHRRQGAGMATSAIRQLEFAVEGAEAFRCRAAYDNLEQGLILAGEFHAHNLEAKVDSGVTSAKVQSAINAASRAFINSCRITDRRK